MKIKSIAISLILSAFIFTGCTNKVFMPYEDQPLCSAGVNWVTVEVYLMFINKK